MISTDEQYDAAMAELLRAWASDDALDADRIAALAEEVDAYDARRWGLEEASPDEVAVVRAGGARL